MKLDSPRARSILLLSVAVFLIGLIVLVLLLLLRSGDDNEVEVSAAYELSVSDREALEASSLKLVSQTGNYGVKEGALTEDTWMDRQPLLMEMVNEAEENSAMKTARAAFENLDPGFFASGSPFTQSPTVEYPSHYLAFEGRSFRASEPSVTIPEEGYLLGETPHVNVRVAFTSTHSAMMPTLPLTPDWDGTIEILTKTVSENVEVVFALTNGVWRVSEIRDYTDPNSLSLTAPNEELDPASYSVTDTWSVRDGAIPDDHTGENTQPFYSYE